MLKFCFSALMIAFSLAVQASAQSSSIPNSKTVKIEIWSDVVCPFCFLGKKKIEQAVRKLNAEDQVEITWRSFQLDPEFPLHSAVPSMENLSERKGYPIGQVRRMCNSLEQQGKGYGIDFDFEKALTFNTQDAHRLIQWANSKGAGSAVKEAMMEAYFSKGIDLSKQENLLDIVEAQGLDRQQAKGILESDAFLQEVQNDIARSRQLGITGVPFFLVNGQMGISGAQPDEVFERVLGEALGK